MMIAPVNSTYRLAMAGAIVSVIAAAQARGELDIVVPAYFYPSANSPWVDMTAVADDVAITAIMNPSSGPGAAKDNNYVAAVNAFRAAGGRVIGYVHTSYGARPLATVTADIDRYAEWYDIDGIFVDEMANVGPAERLNYYKAIYDHAKGIDGQWEVMGNPGTHTIEQYLTWPTADRLVVFENASSAYPAYSPSAWNAKYDRAHFVHLIHTEPSADSMRSRLEMAVARGAGGVYVTNDVMNNPWNTLPSYWQAEVDAVAAFNASLMSADFDQNGSVDAEDLALWRAGFGQFETGASQREGDATGEGRVDGADFLAWQESAGASSTRIGAVQVRMLHSAPQEPLPEPCGWPLASIAAGAVIHFRRNRHYWRNGLSWRPLHRAVVAFLLVGWVR
jgi:hypothetical protein